MQCQRILVGLVLISCAKLTRADDAIFFSDQPKLVGPLLAAPRDPQVKVSFIQSSGLGTFFEPAFGGDVGIYFKRLSGEGEPMRAFSLMVRGMVAPRFQFNSKSFDLWNTDFIGGPQASYRNNQNVYEFWIMHESSHEGPDIAPRTHPDRNFSFESLRLLYSRIVRPNLRWYVGVETVVHADPQIMNGTTGVRAGVEWHIVGIDPSLYLASDNDAKQTHNWKLSTALQVGYDLGSAEKVQRRQRVFVSFFHGYSPQGQFYVDRETSVAAGMAMTF